MCGMICGIVTTAIGGVLVVTVSLVGYLALPGIIDTFIENALVLRDDTIQMERFKEVPFPLTFNVRLWTILNEEEVEAGGVPRMAEVGPYVYRVYQRRLVHKIEDDLIHYRIKMNFEFDAEASYPHTEDDIVTMVNVPYHAILQVAEAMFPTLMPALGIALNGIFGAANNKPIVSVRVGDLLFDGIKLCDSPGLVGGIACSQVRDLSKDAQNLQEQPDGSLIFSLLSYRNNRPSAEYISDRGLEDSSQLGIIKLFESLPSLLTWQDGAEGRGSGLCNMVNGTDSGIFPPFVDREKSLYALNTDICRSVELRYQYDTEYEGIPTVRFSSNDWFLDNHEGCFCLNVTRGINADDGCLLEGAMELFTCVGAFLVLTYPHFLYADARYRNGVIGANPVEENHRIFVDLEPNTGTPVRGMKRAQFNVFMRPVTGIAATERLRTTLTPIVWVEEGLDLPEEFVDELTSSLLVPLNLVAILLPVLIAVTALVFVIGLVIFFRARSRRSSQLETLTPMART